MIVVILAYGVAAYVSLHGICAVWYRLKRRPLGVVRCPWCDPEEPSLYCECKGTGVVDLRTRDAR